MRKWLCGNLNLNRIRTALKFSNISYLKKLVLRAVYHSHVIESSINHFNLHITCVQYLDQSQTVNLIDNIEPTLVFL